MSDDQILHVSDTALLVAACRASESAAPNGIVHDPFAERLAGARGIAIAQAFPAMVIMRFGVTVRCRFMDELVVEAIPKHGIRTVVSVGCGLDSRPWRLDLPSDLRWIEVDFPAMLDYKESVMNSVEPKCRRERVAADLTDASQRHAIFSAVGSDRALMITEGLLMYLPADTVESLTTEAHSQSGIRFWMLDATSPDLDRRLAEDSRQEIQNVRAENHLNGVEILDRLRQAGWTVNRHRSYTRDSMQVAAARIASLVASGEFKPPTNEPPPPDDPSGVYLMERL